MASPNVKGVTDSTFQTEVLEANLPVVACFWATWSGPCRQMLSIIDQVADNYVGKLKVVSIEIDDNPETTRKYGVITVPTTVVFRDGSKQTDIIGTITEDSLVRRLGF
ncbi:MAG: conjugal transfer protein TraF [Anaerolineales bacterium]|nr:conjugal transfer protein TraF [Anaerolineales bacterium]